MPIKQSVGDNQMDFFSKLIKGKESNETLWKRSLVKDLIFLSAIDGEVDEKEVAELFHISVEIGVDPKEFEYVLNNIKKVKAVYPDNDEKRIEYILALIRMTYSDDYIDDDQVRLMMIIADNMGYKPEIITDLIQTINSESAQSDLSNLNSFGGMRLEDAEVDVIAIVKNNQVVFVNIEADHLFKLDKDGDKKLDGKIVNISFQGQSSEDLIEFFVAFDDSDSYLMFNMDPTGVVRDLRLHYVANAVFQHFLESKQFNLFTDSEGYHSQYEYNFKLYQKGSQYFMINAKQTAAYLIDAYGINRAEGYQEVDEIKSKFWNV